VTPAELRIRRVAAFRKIAIEELSAAKMLSGEHRPQNVNPASIQVIGALQRAL
jgi:hypothetical protein